MRACAFVARWCGVVFCKSETGVGRTVAVRRVVMCCARAVSFVLVAETRAKTTPESTLEELSCMWVASGRSGEEPKRLMWQEARAGTC